jgi:hypothetical protein
MTDIIVHKHSISSGDVPDASEIDLGELAIQAADGHIYLKKANGTVIRVTMLPGGDTQQVLYKTGAGDYALGWGTISSTLMGSTLWSEVVAEVQRVFALVEGTASVLLSAPATLTAGSTGPLTVSVADSSYLTAGTSITGVLGTVYGTLSRSGTTYSFVSNQSYTSNITFANGTRFAAAFLNDTFNPLRIGGAEVEDDNSYADGSGYSHAVIDSAGRIGYGVTNEGAFNVPSGNVNLDDAKLQEDVSFADGPGYARVEVDKNGRIAWGIKNDGTVAIKKALFENDSIFQGDSTFESDVTIEGDLLVQGETVTIDVTNLTIEDNTILLNKGESGSGVSLGSAGIEVDRGAADNVKFEWNEAGQAWIAEESIRTNSSAFVGSSSSEEDLSYTDGSGYYKVVLDSAGRVGYGLKSDGSFDVNGAVATKTELGYEAYAEVELDDNNRISRAILTSGKHYFPKADFDELTIRGERLAVTSNSIAGGSLGLFESRSDGTNHQIYRYYNGIESQLTTQGDNFGISLTDETQKRILFFTTRNGASERYVMDADGSRSAPALGTSDLTLWGDSMSGTFGVSTTEQSFIDAGETGYSRAFRNQGSGGLSSIVIAMQMGAAGWTVEVPGGQINASGNTTVNNMRAAIYTDFATEKGLNLDPFEYSNFIAKMPRQRVGGVIGKIKRQTASSVTTTGTGSADAPTIAVADATGIAIGMLVKQTDGNEDKIILGTTVTGISGTALTLSASNVSALSSVSLDFYVNSGYYFERETAGDAVTVNGPQKVVPITNNGFGTDQSYPQTNMEDLLNSIQILWPFGPHGSGGDDPATMEMIVLDAIINQGLTALSKKYVMLNAVASSTKAISNINDYGTVVKTTDVVEQAYINNYSDRYLSIIDASLNGNSSLSVSSFKAWFNSNYPAIYSSSTSPYAWDGLGANASFRQTTTSGVTAVTLVNNGTSGTQNTASVDTTTDGSGVALRLGVVASGGVATAIWIREPGHNYAASDTVTIPAGAIGNSAAITATVGSIGSATPGNDVFNQDGSIDVANAYNEWDVGNGYMPRAMFADNVHLSTYGKEFVRFLVANFILTQGW